MAGPATIAQIREGDELADLKWFVGIDWGSRIHQACILDANGDVRAEHAFAHGGAGFAALTDWILSGTEEAPADQVGVAIETPRGPVVETLLGCGFAVHSINPRQLDRFRDRYSHAGAKDDRRDALVLASALRTDPHRLLRVKPTAPAIVELREWSRIVESLTRERVRLSNRMCDQLWRYYPEFINVVEDFNVHWALALWNRVPTPAAVRGVRLSTLEKLLKKHRVRRITAEELRDQLTARAIDIDPSAIRAAETHARIIAKQLALVNQQLTEANSRLEALVTQLAEAAPDPDESSEPGQHKEQRDVAILRSLPGVGTVILATLFAEADDALQRRDYHALRCLCGVAPVTKRSGKSMRVSLRRAAHRRLRNATYHWARVAMQKDPVCKAKYQVLRSRGHGHARSLRSVADRLLNVACAMLRDQTLFDPQHASAAAGSHREAVNGISIESSVVGPVELVGERGESVGNAVGNA